MSLRSERVTVQAVAVHAHRAGTVTRKNRA